MDYLNLQKDIVGKNILKESPLFKEIHRIKQTNEKLIIDLNTQYHDKEKKLHCLKEIIGKEIDSSVEISLPFYSDFGKNISFGKNIFINQNVTFVDLGGITIEDNVLIGPDARLITVNHLVNPESRRGIRVNPICIKKNAWIGANATILPGITVGENSIVAADSTVTKNVPDNVMVAGSPARVIKQIEKDKGDL